MLKTIAYNVYVMPLLAKYGFKTIAVSRQASKGRLNF
jgi:hypothetical protein